MNDLVRFKLRNGVLAVERIDHFMVISAHENQVCVLVAFFFRHGRICSRAIVRARYNMSDLTKDNWIVWTL